MAAYIQKSVPQLTKSSLAIEEMRSWAEELAHMFSRNADMQERTQVFSCYERGLEKTIKRDFESRGKDIAKLRDFKYPGSTEAQICDWDVGGGNPSAPRVPYSVAARLRRRMRLHNANCGLGDHCASGA